MSATSGQARDSHKGGWYIPSMTTQVPVRLTEADLAALDAAIARGRFANRSAALRLGLERILHGRTRAARRSEARALGRHDKGRFDGR
jgi:Arc/MetJ-type ribon-helix-helix transcriptional regulator